MGLGIIHAIFRETWVGLLDWEQDLIKCCHSKNGRRQERSPGGVRARSRRWRSSSKSVIRIPRCGDPPNIVRFHEVAFVWRIWNIRRASGIREGRRPRPCHQPTLKRKSISRIRDKSDRQYRASGWLSWTVRLVHLDPFGTLWRTTDRTGPLCQSQAVPLQWGPLVQSCCPDDHGPPKHTSRSEAYQKYFNGNWAIWRVFIWCSGTVEFSCTNRKCQLASLQYSYLPFIWPLVSTLSFLSRYLTQKISQIANRGADGDKSDQQSQQTQRFLDHH